MNFSYKNNECYYDSSFYKEYIVIAIYDVNESPIAIEVFSIKNDFIFWNTNRLITNDVRSFFEEKYRFFKLKGFL